jgi:hypothetical protein
LEEICKQDQAAHDAIIKEGCLTRSLHIAYAGSLMAMVRTTLPTHAQCYPSALLLSLHRRHHSS